VLAIASPVGLFGQSLNSPVRQVSSNSQAAAARIPLDIYNFAIAGPVDDPQWAERLQLAVSDSLLLQFLGQPGIDSRRIREAFRAAAVSAGTKSLTTNQSSVRVPEGPVRYVLDGRLTFAEPPGGTLHGPDSASHSHIIVVKYSLREIGKERESRVLLESDETTTLSRLPSVMAKISEDVTAQLLPPSKITVQLDSVEVAGLASEKRSYYSDNLSALLQAAAQGAGWIDLVGPESKAQYAVKETATLQSGEYALEATILSREGQQPPRSLRSSGPQGGILTAQLALARRVVDNLDLERHHALFFSGSDNSREPSADEYIKAASVYDESNPDVAIPLYRRALELDPSSLKTKLNLARAYLHTHDGMQALKSLEGSDVDASATGQLMRSFAYSFLAKPDKALETANLAVKLGPRLDVAYWWRGQVKADANDFRGALSDYQKALELDPKDPDYYEGVARAQEELKNYAGAVEVLGRGRQQTDQNEKLGRLQNDVRRRAALSLIQSGQPKEALTFAQATVKDEPKSELGQRVLGMAYHLLKRFAESEAALTRALQIEETPESLSEMASLRFDQNQTAAAYQFATKAIQKDPEGSQAYPVLNETARSLGRTKQTVDFLKTVWKANPRSFPALEAWDYLQLAFLPRDQAGLDSLYAAYDSTLQTVSYKDWIGGWANMVELALISGNYNRAAAIAQEMLDQKPSLDYALTLGFYLWLVHTMQGDCARAQAAWSTFVGYLGNEKVDGMEKQWDFTATRQFIEQAAQAGTISPSARAISESGFGLLELPVLRRNEINRFLAAYAGKSTASCR
jgi:tetratricopeptide (TPR) repeat protein